MYRTYLDVVHIALDEKARQFADSAAVKASQSTQQSQRPATPATPDSQVNI